MHNHGESCIIMQAHFQHDSLLKAFSHPISLACCQLSTDWENNIPRMPQMQELTSGPGQVELTVGITGIRDPELKSTVFWVILAVSKISNQFSVQCLTQWPLQQKNVTSYPQPKAWSASVVAGCQSFCHWSSFFLCHLQVYRSFFALAS